MKITEFYKNKRATIIAIEDINNIDPNLINFIKRFNL